MLQDCRRAIRSLLQRRGLALAVIGTLTLSIGATSAIFSAIDAIVLRPLPYPDSDRLVAVFETTRQQSTSLIALVRLEEWSRLTRSFEGLAGSYSEGLTDTTGPVPERLAAMRTSPGFFAVLGTPAALGRTFAGDEERFGGPAAIVLSDALWRSRYGADPSIIGRSLRIGEQSRTVVGVMPPLFQYPTPRTEAWIPAQPLPALAQSRETRWYVGVGRLRPGVTLEQAQQDLAAAQARLATEFPATDGGSSAAILPLKEELIGGVRRSLWLLFGAVLLMLLAACGNIAGLLVADGARRETQVAVQFALGAPRSAIVRQRLIEGALLALAGSLAGLAVGFAGTRLIVTVATRLPRATELHLNWRLVAFALVTGIMATVVFALVPALQATRRDPARTLSHGTRGQVGGRQRLQRTLVAAQVAFAIVLLVGAGLLVRSFIHLQRVPPGFDPNHLLSFRISASWAESGQPAATGARHQRILARLAEIPGVIDVAQSNVLPSGPDADYPPAAFDIAGRSSDPSHVAQNRQVSAGYFRTLRIPILRGNECPAEAVGEPVTKIVVNQAFASRFFPGENPIGHQIVRPPLPMPLDIAGVVGDAREQSLLKDPQPTTYICGGMAYLPDPFFLVRLDPNRAPGIAAIRAAMGEVESQRAVYVPRMLAEVIGDAWSQPQLNTILLGFFAAIAVVLVAVGLYAMLAQFVGERTREIGVRLALGARPAQVLGQVLRQTAWVTAVGISGGLASAALLARYMAALVFGISARDPLTFAAVPVLIAAVALGAALLPARRAARLDPLTALREA